MTTSHETYCPICKEWYNNSGYGCPDCNDSSDDRADYDMENKRDREDEDDFLDREMDKC